MPQAFKRIALLLLIMLSLIQLHGQGISSPYSRYGIGDLYSANNTLTLSMGGSGLGWSSPEMVNYLNPASYAAFDTLSFLFEGGMASKFNTLKTLELSQKSNYTSLNNLLFGFPINRWWKASIGLLPFSQMGYKISDTQVMDSIGLVRKTFEGNGGINQVYLGHGFRINKSLYAGVNIAYLFGTLDKTRALTFPDSVNIFNFHIINTTTVGDFLFTYGLQYKKDLSENYRLGVGATYTASTKVNTKEFSLSETYVTGSTGINYIKDTIEMVPEFKGNILLPSAYGTGITLERRGRWVFNADYRFQNWDKFTYLGENDSLRNSYQVSAGFQLIPSEKAGSRYLQKINYRFGVRYGKTYLQLRESQLAETAFSFGLGLPLARSRSRVNFGFEIGQRGTTENQLIQENFYRFSIGVSVYERWFVRRKFE